MRKMIGTKTMMLSIANNGKKRTVIGAVSTIGAMAGLGIAYMAYRSRRSREEGID